MACCGAVITPESSVIDAQIKSDEKILKASLKVLVLGTSASGKSTVAKQMKILHCHGFSTEELHNYKQILILNIFNGMKELVFQAEQFGIKILRKNKKVAAYFSNANPYTETLNSETVDLAKQLWDDKGTRPSTQFVYIVPRGFQARPRSPGLASGSESFWAVLLARSARLNFCSPSPLIPFQLPLSHLSSLTLCFSSR